MNRQNSWLLTVTSGDTSSSSDVLESDDIDVVVLAISLRRKREIQVDSFVRQQTTNSYSMSWLVAGGLGSVDEDYKIHQQHCS